MRIGVTEILIIIFAILLLFGSKKIPELFRSLGKSLNEFKRGQAESDPEKTPDKSADSTTPGKPDPTELTK